MVDIGQSESGANLIFLRCVLLAQVGVRLVYSMLNGIRYSALILWSLILLFLLTECHPQKLFSMFMPTHMHTASHEVRNLFSKTAIDGYSQDLISTKLRCCAMYLAGCRRATSSIEAPDKPCKIWWNIKHTSLDTSEPVYKHRGLDHELRLTLTIGIGGEPERAPRERCGYTRIQSCLQ